VAEPIRVHDNASRKNAWTRATELLKAVRIAAPETRVREYPHQLSGGMRQRIVGAIAISCEPRILIADEPTTSLDLTIQAQYLKLLRDLQRSHNLALIFITHNLGIVAKMCDRVAVMYAGKIVETAATGTLFSNPRHPYTEALFQALPDQAAETRERLYSIRGAPPDLMHPPQGCRFAPRCRYATDQCTEEEPRLGGESFGHHYACFHPVGQTERHLERAAVVPDQRPEPAAEMPWTFAVPGRGHDLTWWTGLVRALAGSRARVVSIEHEDPFVPAETGVPEAARVLRAAIDAARTAAA